MDTIVALASAPGRSGVAVIRVSGELAWRVCERLCRSVPAPRKASVRILRDAEGEMIDQALVICFAEGASFTGDKVVEFHVHGSPAVVRAVLNACMKEEGIRAAAPGEFTRRAYEAGRMSISQVEGLADLLDAETEMQRRQALRLMGGEADRKISDWRDLLLRALVYLEASIDFSDEEIPSNLAEDSMNCLSLVEGAISKELANRAVAEGLREGFEVAIVGQVNVGKSTLLNALSGREAAITSEHAGTTRDVIEVRMDLGGFPVTLIDTAGLRAADDPVELIGISRGVKRAREADLRIYLKETPGEFVEAQHPDDIVILSKCDKWGMRGVSGVTGEGLDALIDTIATKLGASGKPSVLFSRARHFEQLARAEKSLKEAREMIDGGCYSEELVSELVRSAVVGLDTIMGRVDVEEVLGGIFSSFCIGK